MSFRKEEKLKIHKGQLAKLMSWIYENNGTLLHERRIVSSTYFDNDDWTMFNESEEGTVPRKKIRVRSYSEGVHEPGTSALEVKVSSIEGRFKTTRKQFDLDKVMAMGVFDSQYGVCKPKLRVTYSREYYQIFEVRLTIDQNIRYALVHGNRKSGHEILDNEVAIEVKAADNVSFQYLFDQFPFERVRFSKYSHAVNCLLHNSAAVY